MDGVNPGMLTVIDHVREILSFISVLGVLIYVRLLYAALQSEV